MKTTQERMKNIQEKYKRECEEQPKKERRRKRNLWVAISSCAAALVLTLALVLFIPYPTHTFSLDQFKSSEYYELIKKVDEFRPKPKQGPKNNFEAMLESIQDALGSKKGASSEAPGNAMPPTSSDGSGNSAQSPSHEQYEEVTDNQVAGVVEGDLFKRTNEKIYYLSADDSAGTYILSVYPIAGLNTKKSASLEITPDEGTRFKGYLSEREFYLNENGTKATVLTPCYKAGTLYTAIIGIDLAGETPTETGRAYVSGDYVSSRLVNGKLLLVTNFRITGYEYGDEGQYLPQYGALDNLKSVPMENIVMPDKANVARYTVVSTLDEETLAVTDTVALLSYSEEVYVSSGNIYATYYRAERSEKDNGGLYCYAYDGNYYYRTWTTVSMISYADGLIVKGAFEVNGQINNRYSMDEYEGVFRVFTTTNKKTDYQSTHWQSGKPYTYSALSSNASLYCYDVSTLELIASKENFVRDDGERVRSARFDGTTAYVCTAIQVTDPVFAFDLSDYQNITSVDTGTIPGYSLSLATFKDETLLGIGFSESTNNMKIELYEKDGSAVTSVSSYEIERANFSYEYKSYLIDRNRGLVGIAVSEYKIQPYGVEEYYLLLQYDGYNLVELAKIPLSDSQQYYYSIGKFDDVRATVIDGYLYLFIPDGTVKVQEIDG